MSCFSTNKIFLLRYCCQCDFKDLGNYNCSLINKKTFRLFYKTCTNYILKYYNNVWKIICCTLGLSPKWNDWCNVWVGVQYGEYTEHLFQWQWTCSGITSHFICNQANSPSAGTVHTAVMYAKKTSWRKDESGCYPVFNIYKQQHGHQENYSITQ
jgi:hypothetical protein